MLQATPFCEVVTREGFKREAILKKLSGAALLRTTFAAYLLTDEGSSDRGVLLVITHLTRSNSLFTPPAHCGYAMPLALHVR